jgi:hypothetical protein
VSENKKAAREWRQNYDGRCNADCLSLFTLHGARSGAVIGVVFPRQPDSKLWGWAAIGGWSGTESTIAAARSAVENLEIIKRLP